MKISLRILLINFVIVVLVFVSSTIAFYSLTRKIVISQQSKNLLNSSKDFIYSLQTAVQETDEEFLKLVNSGRLGSLQSIADLKTDFIIGAGRDSVISPALLLVKDSLYTDKNTKTISGFFNNYPNTIIREYKKPDGSFIYYGRILDGEMLDNISKRIRADVAVLNGNVPVITSNYSVNQKYLFDFINLARDLSVRNSFDIGQQELAKADLYATYYIPKEQPFINPRATFLIFSTLPEAAELRENINNMLVIIGLTGVTLSLILSLIFTEKIRKQITHLSHAAAVTRSGNLKNRVTMLTKDELGSLGIAFNSMLDDLERNQNIRNEYTEFISLINQNPSLKEISEAALTKIIKSTGYTVGRLFLVEEGRLRVLSSYGLQTGLDSPEKDVDLYQRAIEKNEAVELTFTENSPVISTGLVKLEIRNLLVYPVLYNKKVIAVLELASISEVKKGVRDYLDNIHHQLAIGLSNAYAFYQLENMVTELQKLNDDYQRQNEQIVEQNKTLLGLHRELREKAEELELQKAKAIEATNLKSQFLASMSHELKTPLNSVLGLTELVLNDKALSMQGRERLEIVLRNGSRLMNLINDILNFSRMESGKMEMRMEEFPVSEMLGEIKMQIEPLLRGKDIRLEIDRKIPIDEVIYTDKFKLSQILINLLSNAVKFTEKGSINIAIEIENSTLKLEVKDTGIGIAEKDIEVIFDEFRQVDGSSKRKYSGTGLGLAISRRYAGLLNGTLTCISTPGEGSVFTLSIPVRMVERKAAPAEAAKKELARTILIVDNIEEHVKVIADYFALKDYGVIHTLSIDEALNKAEETKPLIIALNSRISDTGVWNMLAKIRRSQAAAEIPVVLYTIVDELNIGYGFQIFDYFIKPAASDSVNQLIRKLNELSGKIVCSVAYIGDSGEMNSLIDASELNSEGMQVVPSAHEDIQTAFRHIARQQPDLVIADLDHCGPEGILLIKRLKDFSDTKDIPVAVCFSGSLGEKESALLSNAVEEAAIKSKGHPIDILKVLRDRIQLEEGRPVVDNSGFWASETQYADEVPPLRLIPGDNKPQRNKILIVDDDTDTLFTVSEIVHQTGCETALARNGVECMNVLQHYTPDIILLDIMMPQMDGFETIRRIRSDSGLSDIPVFALTALAMIGEKEILMRNGFTDLIPKPVNAALLISRIESILQKTQI